MKKTLVLGEKINSGFFNTVYLHNDGKTVIKVPKRTGHLINQTKENIQYALQSHQEHLGPYIPQTSIILSHISPMGYIMEQEYIKGIKLTSRDIGCWWDFKGHQRDDILFRGLAMEKKAKIYFDVYGIGDYIPNIRKLLHKKPCTIGNMLIDSDHKIHYIDIGYLRTDSVIGFGCKSATNLMTALIENT